MFIRSVHIKNFKSFQDTDELALGPVNVFVGRNNCGKSAIIRAIYALQMGSGVGPHDIRLGADESTIKLQIADVDKEILGEAAQEISEDHGTLEVSIGSGGLRGLTFSYMRNGDRVSRGRLQLSNSEPTNFIYPFFSRRKVFEFDESVNLPSTNAVTHDLRNLAAKVSRLANPTHERHSEYEKACKDVIGFMPSAVASPNGQKPGVPVARFRSIYIEAMGDGVSNLLGLITDLCISVNRVFLIEEPENDVHPQALKRLLALILEKSTTNQFLITTHSNIVTKYLGAAPESRLFQISADLTAPVPTSSISEIYGTEERIAVLSNLGYELYDFDLWEGWLFFEESSAERIIRSLLIPWFEDRLSRVRTVGLHGLGDVEPAFAEYHRLFLFAHLEPLYKERAWVVLDGDDGGKAIVDRLRTSYAGWDPRHFRFWSKPQFEQYYPARFQEQVASTFTSSGRERQAAKEHLLREVMEWATANPELARQEFEESAAEVIQTLIEIGSALFDPR